MRIELISKLTYLFETEFLLRGNYTPYLREGLAMASMVEQLLGSYYCRLALLLCQQARENLYSGSPKKASELCRFISTLCARNVYAPCHGESKLCSQVAEKCLSGDGLEEAKRICERARKLCPKSFNVYGG